jgi:predicted RNA-binding protein with PUA-like domain
MLSGMAELYWLVKTEPAAYSWKQFVADGKAAWTGVRNFQARNNLRAMKTGNPVLFYHSVTGKEVIGIAEVAREAYPDPTAKEGDWSCVDLVPARALITPVPLETLKTDPATQTMGLVRNSRISVTPVTAAEYRRVLQLSGGPLR